MKRQFIRLLFCIVLIGCSHENQREMLLQEQMTARYGENQVLTEVPEGVPSVKVENGTFVGSSTEGIVSFKGIPYAQPPVGALRWREPLPPDSSDTIREALYFGKSCIQTHTESQKASYYRQGEDCLTLNIWTNAAPAVDGSADSLHSFKPVMVWIHGGSYGWGGTSDPLYDGHRFAKAHPEIVLVTVNYRVGIFGFLDLTQMKGGETYTTSGNLGLLDQVAALEWVQRNIRQFGGNPEQVTIFGESAGGGSVSLLTVMPRAKGLFCRTIAQSGSVALSSDKESHAALIERVRQTTGAKTVDDLKQLREADLMAMNEELNEYNCFPLRDGIVVPIDPYAAYADGTSRDVTLLMGTNADEARYWIDAMGGVEPYKLLLSVWYDNILASLPDNERQAVESFVENGRYEKVWNKVEFINELMFRAPMQAMADRHADAGGQVYTYYWSYPSGYPGHGAQHAMEVSYILNNFDETFFSGGHVNEALAKEAQQMWVNFAVTGDPSTPARHFPLYTTDSRQCMRLDQSIRIENDLLSEQRQVVAPLVSHYISPLYTSMSLNVPTVWRCVGCLLLVVVLLVLASYLFSLRRARGIKCKANQKARK